MGCAAIVLAAGEGKRMKSKKPKVAHELLGKPLVRWVVDAARAADIERIVTVVGHGRDQVIPLVEADSAIVEQTSMKGTADAVLRTKEALADFSGSILVLSGDCPLITPETLRALIELRESSQAAAVLLTMQAADPFGYGRVIRGETREVLRIVEQRDASPKEACIKECNAGFYCFDASVLFDALVQVKSDNAQGEFYLTDVIEICVKQGLAVRAFTTEYPEECSGINSREQLAQAGKYAQRRINAVHMLAGVTMTDPDLVWIGPDVVIAQDVELLPMVMLAGMTSIGEGSIIGPNSRIIDTQVGSDCVIDETVAVQAQIDDRVSCGPRAYLRPGTHLCEGAKAGTHVEIKKSTIGKGSKVPHLSYIGDTTMGKGVNIGAGSITCNYDGKKKWETVIGNDVFVGSDTMMVAPLKIGDGSLIAAGSVINRDVSAGALAIGRAEQIEKPGWVEKKKKH